MFLNRISNTVNGIEVNVYQLDESNQSMDVVNYLESYLIRKIKAMKIHQDFVVNDVFNVPTLKKEYIERINLEIRKVNTPTSNKLNWFDVRRSRVTEFMSQFLLEEEHRCTFFEEADKRINLAEYETDKHVSGVDVTGIQERGEVFKFVLCEVKASKEKRIPCSSASDLLSDIYNAYTNVKRILREIACYYRKLGNELKIGDLAKILDFLLTILIKSSSREVILENVIFIPFLIRNNPDIIENKNLDDFRDFKIEDFIGADIKGIIWSVNFDIDQFSKEIYNRVLDIGQ